MSEVSTLLAQSRAAHADYQRADQQGNPVLSKIAITQAKLLREQAHNLDPAHDDGGWVDDVVPHDAYERFYEAYLRESATH